MTEVDLSCATWHKSRRSQQNGACVEMALLSGPQNAMTMGVRDSKNPDGEILIFAPIKWASFLARIKRNELDL